jgi:hypothetical protein
MPCPSNCPQNDDSIWEHYIFLFLFWGVGGRYRETIETHLLLLTSEALAHLPPCRPDHAKELECRLLPCRWNVARAAGKGLADGSAKGLRSCQNWPRPPAGAGWNRILVGSQPYHNPSHPSPQDPDPTGSSSTPPRSSGLRSPHRP